MRCDQRCSRGIEQLQRLMRVVTRSLHRSVQARPMCFEKHGPIALDAQRLEPTFANSYQRTVRRQYGGCLRHALSVETMQHHGSNPPRRLDQAADFRAVIQSRTKPSRMPSGMAPFISNTSWNAFRSNFAPSSRSASARILSKASCPTLYPVA